MKRFEKTKGFIMGLLVASILFGGFTAFAWGVGPRWETIWVAYDNYRIVINGVPFQAVEPNGTVIEPFAFEDRIFAPFEHIARALGMTSNWDQFTNTLHLATAGGGGGFQQQPPQWPEPTPFVPQWPEPTPFVPQWPEPTPHTPQWPEPTPFTPQQPSHGPGGSSFPAGRYTAGSDLPPGRYVLTSDTPGSVIILNNNQRTLINQGLNPAGGPHASGVPTITLSVNHGYDIRLEGFQGSVTFAPAPDHMSNVLTTGVWTVGIHIAEGEYNARPTSHGDRGNLIVTNPDGRSALNELLETSIRVTLTHGQTVRIAALTSVTFER